MAGKKTWIKIKRGILEPKHITKLGQAWYLYFYILDNADWETGTIKEWKDEYASQDLEKPIGMIREHRKHLVAEEYITCEKKRYSQTITIHNWTNPRRYDGEVLNFNAESSEKDECLATQSKGKDQCLTEDDFQSSGQSTTQSSGQTILDPSVKRAPFIQSQNHSITESQLKDTTTTAAFSAYQSNIGMITSFIKDDLIDLVDTYTDGWVVDAIKEAVRSNVRNLAYVEKILSRWKVQGKDDGRQKREYQGRQGAETASEHNAKILEEIANGTY
jgi:DnaD/phage-associated family protein